MLSVVHKALMANFNIAWFDLDPDEGESSFLAATRVVPDPANGSSTKELPWRGANISTNFFIRGSGLTVQWTLKSSVRPHGIFSKIFD